ncbi:MAG: transglutaminase domain-containing protein [Candidatus Levybacteria bacterium]|nr:transglutaminase domain-containing protein [Candidatus Levybacteria bacterium]
MRIIKTLLIILAIFLFTVFSCGTASARENFTTSYNVNYKILDNGQAYASFSVVLTNNSNEYYASSYKIRIGFEDIRDLVATDPDGRLVTKITKTDEGQEIELVFNKRVVGIGNTLPFNMSFYTNDISAKEGSIWEINIPGISNKNDFSSFSVKLDVPASFGDPVYIKPDIGSKSLTFSKEQLGKSGISVSFGKSQIYSFNLSYHLQNKNLFPLITEVALPPTTNYQDVSIEDINPKPDNVIKDIDGNWLARYRLSPSKKMDVVVKGKAQVYLYPKSESLSKENFELYLKQQPYWEQDENIKELARTLKTPYAIYTYVAKTLKYDFSRVTASKPRLGARGVLENPSSAVCLEFTDLFIAITRAAGIPAREIDGYAYTQNDKQRPLSLVKDILHAWPEFYDTNLGTWIMVDPTWGNTTKGVDYFNILDFDHFAFVIRGKDSSYPIPAGGYKLSENAQTQDVKVEFADSYDISFPKVEVGIDLPQKTLSGLPVQGFVIFRNTSSVVYPAGFLSVEADGLLPKLTKSTYDEIPPYGYIKVPLVFSKTPLLTNSKANVRITVNGNVFSQEILILPFYLTVWEIIIGGILIVSITTILSIYLRKSGGIPFFRRKQ